VTSKADLRNQASITGESLPVDKNESDDIFAGTQNSPAHRRESDQGRLRYPLGKVKEMILAPKKNTHAHRKIIDKYAGYYTPTILMIAV
jgi:Cd2+/Zn2+-exporting ATPase